MTRLEQLLEEFNTHDAALARISEFEVFIKDMHDLPEHAYTVAHQLARERSDNPPDDWVGAFVEALCARLLAQKPITQKIGGRT